MTHFYQFSDNNFGNEDFKKKHGIILVLKHIKPNRKKDRKSYENGLLSRTDSLKCFEL